ncbi:MAG TPA: bifunctional aspartate kinase/homoserine dehydrogenase I [Chitinophagales bacterium]|jgi:aspartokinase/homoserine dehydrogenase 1|nr:bifunctional aspartate kinase/homoserine dehydrogenase I [Chitinophagales bacterium]
MKVLKFGGSSVGSIENIHRIINIVRAEKAQDKEVVLVCSAFNKVTDQLINAGKLAEKKDNNTYLEIFQNFKDRHQTTIENIIEDTAIKKEMMDEFFESMDRVEDILKGVHLLGELSDKTLAQLVSYGERFSCFIVAGALRNAGLNGIYVNATQLVRTDSNYLSAKVNFEKTNKNIADFFEAVHGVAVVTGFIGTDEHGNVTTLGRGGSDYTAAIFAAALKASAIEIWTDVDGVLTADPRRVEQAFTIPTLSYKEAMELSHFGAKVIYPPSIQPAYIKNIPLIIKNTFNPEHPGTYISKDSGKSANIIKGISSLSDIALLRMEGTGMVGVVGIASRLFATLSRAGINIIFLTQGSSEHSICFGILPGEIKKAQKSVEEEFRYEIQNRQILPLVIETNNSIIAVIGENMTNSPGVSAKMFKALGKNGINVKAIAQGSSELNITAVIEQVNEAKALNALHEIFFENDVHSVNVFLVGPTGLIGKTLLKQIKNQFDFLQNEKSMQINVTGITNSKKMLIDSNGIDLSDWENELNENGTEANLEAFTRKMVEMNFANTVFVDCSASKHVVEFYEKLLKKSISIVTPNKIANTLSQDKYNQLRKLAKQSNARFMYETNVGAGLPVIGVLQSLLNSGDKILKIEAVLSGTLSYIFNTYKGDLKFSDVVLDAKEKGFTEPDPRDDLSGLDVARKALILSRDSGGIMELSDIAVENLVPASMRDIDVKTFLQKLPELDAMYESVKQEAESKGNVLRYMAVIENGQVQIALKQVDAQHPFYNLSGSDNMIVFTTERYKNNPLVIKGPGAGAEVTAAGVFAEIISIGNYMAN